MHHRSRVVVATPHFGTLRVGPEPASLGIFENFLFFGFEDFGVSETGTDIGRGIVGFDALSCLEDGCDFGHG